jgi:hypothetical protein
MVGVDQAELDDPEEERPRRRRYIRRILDEDKEGIEFSRLVQCLTEPPD